MPYRSPSRHASILIGFLGSLLVRPPSLSGQMVDSSPGADLFGLLELPLLILAVVFAFLTASALRGGAFGRGMAMLAWGFLVMAVGHLHLQVQHHFGLNVFESLLGTTGGSVAWFLALMVTWSLTAMGFYSIYRASKGGADA